MAYRVRYDTEVRQAPSRTSQVFHTLCAGRVVKQMGAAVDIPGVGRRIPLVPRGWVDADALELTDPAIDSGNGSNSSQPSYGLIATTSASPNASSVADHGTAKVTPVAAPTSNGRIAATHASPSAPSADHSTATVTPVVAATESGHTAATPAFPSPLSADHGTASVIPVATDKRQDTVPSAGSFFMLADKRQLARKQGQPKSTPSGGGQDKVSNAPFTSENGSSKAPELAQSEAQQQRQRADDLEGRLQQAEAELQLLRQKIATISEAAKVGCFIGTLKPFNSNKAGECIGWVTCQAAQQIYGTNVYVHGSMLNGLQAGDIIGFEVHVNNKGHPQASTGTIVRLGHSPIQDSDAAATSLSGPLTSQEGIDAKKDSPTEPYQ